MNDRLRAAFDQIARLTRDKFYRTDMNGVDWDHYVATYRRLLPSINNGRDLGNLLAELAGELNVSHTWGVGPGPFPRMADETASLGGYWQESDQGVTLTALLAGGPLEQESCITAGARLLTINGAPITNLNELDRVLNHQAGTRLSLTFQQKDHQDTDEIEVTAISLAQEYQLQLDSWIAKRQKLVATLSKGRVGYVYLPLMNQAAYDSLVAKALGQYRNCEAIILDVRFNKGGFLSNALVQFLTGNNAARIMPKAGTGVSLATDQQWNKPSVVVVNAGSYSDSSVFPTYYRDLKIGPLIGDPVPGSGTAVYSHKSKLIPGLQYGIPTLGIAHQNGAFYENRELIPDLQVPLPPADMVAGRDPQLEVTVQAALKQLPASAK